eukprot:CAMPEP_0113937318 /NCGR_PEP_ID=MMETSP1339-20121228/3964_1 /TAXON_ID=94617 /ORGANISM="Fibrocapsa japonica" /LENGTH=732 /DNA_ID=CAMNT_0000940037 /DNA_START=47 /DNA_END=2241 /DNA_ORIENTATION=+ /assembly_acc=CAM_ASM_000762
MGSSFSATATVEAFKQYKSMLDSKIESGTTSMPKSELIEACREVSGADTTHFDNLEDPVDLQALREKLQKSIDAAQAGKPKGSKMNIEDLASIISLEGKKVFVRVDLNVPLSKEDGTTVTDDTRIRGVVPTISFLINKKAKVIMCSHLGRPKGKVNDAFRLTPVIPRLSELLGVPVQKADDCVGEAVESLVNGMNPGDVLLLENCRFYAGEEKNDPEFAAQLGKLAEVYVNDAFGTAHRAHASTAGICAHVPYKVGGYLMEKELKFLKGAVDEPVKPLAAIVGGAKVSTKITVLESLMEKCQIIALGGGMIYTFLKAQGKSVGSSLCEDEFLDLAKTLMAKAEEKGIKFVLPTDVMCADAFSADANTQVTSADAIPDGWMGLDIGPSSIEMYKSELSAANTVVWNGPMGVFEFDKFATGTMAIAQMLAERTEAGAITIIGGGDSVAAVEKAGLSSKMSHISTGGGASLELLEGKVLPGVAALDDVGKPKTKLNVEGLAARVPLRGKKVFVRVDLNVPLSKEDGVTVTDDTRIRGVVPTVSYLVGQGARVILCSHLGRPKGEVNDAFRLNPVVARLSELVGVQVQKADDTVGEAVQAMVDGMQDGSVLLLENCRFHKGEEKNDPAFAAQLGALCDVYVNDAFGTAHRAHASTAGICAHVPHKAAGYLMEKELKFLKGAVDDPVKPLAAIVGGAKVSTKITVLESLMEKCQIIALGGGMIYTFLKAQGKSVGSS